MGEILFDVFPQGRRLGGAPFNFACHVHGLGGSVRFLSRIGDDPAGREIMASLQSRRFPTGDLQVDPQKPTGRVEVSLDAEGRPRFAILTGVAYDALVSTPAIEDFAASDCRLIYFGSLIQRTDQGARTVRRILDCRTAGTKCLFDVNLRPGCYNETILHDSLPETDVLKVNEDELATLAGMHALGGATEDQVAALQERFAIEMVALTRGPRGSSLFAGGTRHDVQPPGNIHVTDTVGAGDAFAAVLAMGVLGAWPPGRILTTANRLAAAVCGIEGAVPANPAFYDPLRPSLSEGKADG